MPPQMQSAVFDLNHGIITPNAAQVLHSQRSMLVQGIYNSISVLIKHEKIQTSICPAGSSSPESNSPTELISLSESSSSPASSAASLVAYFETYSEPIH